LNHIFLNLGYTLRHLRKFSSFIFCKIFCKCHFLFIQKRSSRLFYCNFSIKGFSKKCLLFDLFCFFEHCKKFCKKFKFQKYLQRNIEKQKAENKEKKTNAKNDYRGDGVWCVGVDGSKGVRVFSATPPLLPHQLLRPHRPLLQTPTRRPTPPPPLRLLPPRRRRRRTRRSRCHRPKTPENLRRTRGLPWCWGLRRFPRGRGILRTPGARPPQRCR